MASNLNRHLKTCKLAPEDAPDAPPPAPPSPAAADDAAPAEKRKKASPTETPGPAHPAPARARTPPAPAHPAARETSVPPPAPLTPPPTRIATEAELITTRRAQLRAEASPGAPAAPPAPAASPKKRAHVQPVQERWIPASLLAFNLGPYLRCAPRPLPPVRPHMAPAPADPALTVTLDAHGAAFVWEERDSFDTDVHASPYHP